MEAIAIVFLSLMGFSALVVVVVGFVKQFLNLPDGRAGQLSAGLNFIGLIVFTWMGLFAPDYDVLALDAWLADLAKYLTIFFALFAQVFTSEQVYKLLRKINLTFVHREEPKFIYPPSAKAAG